LGNAYSFEASEKGVENMYNLVCEAVSERCGFNDWSHPTWMRGLKSQE